MRHLAALIITIFIVISPSCNYLREKGMFGKKSRTLAALRAQQDSIRVADSIRKVQKKLEDFENAKLDSLRRDEEDRAALQQKNKYNIIVGSFITPEYAKSYSETYRQQGYDTKIIKMEGSHFELVSAESHENFRKAVSRLRQFQDTVAFDAWMYIMQ